MHRESQLHICQEDFLHFYSGSALTKPLLNHPPLYNLMKRAYRQNHPEPNQLQYNESKLQIPTRVPRHQQPKQPCTPNITSNLGTNSWWSRRGSLVTAR